MITRTLLGDWWPMYAAFYAAGAVALLAAFGLGVWVGW
jgi:hypothetical protein